MQNDLPWSDKLRPEVSERWEELIQLRREFHKHAELSFQEHWTVQRIKDWLKASGIEDFKAPSIGPGIDLPPSSAQS